MLTQFLILTVALFILGFAANFLVHSSIKIAKLLNVSEAWIGLTIVAMGTSAPEIAVSVSAALNGEGALSVGNVIGSNIFNLGFILGIVCIISTHKISKKTLYRDGTMLLIATVTVLLFMINQTISIFEGAILITMLIGYNAYLFIKRDLPKEEDHEPPAKWYDFIILLVSFIVLIKSAGFIVDAATYIAETFGISQWAIGATIVAAGTSLPEIATSLTATLKGKHGLAIGNVVGSDIFNVLGIIGVSALVAPLQLHSQKTIFGMPDNMFSMSILLIAIIIVLAMMRSGWKIQKLEGWVLVILSVARVGLEIYIGAN